MNTIKTQYRACVWRMCLAGCLLAGYQACAYTFWSDDNWDNWGNANPNLEVTAIAHDPVSGVVYVGGRFTSIGGIQATGVAMWTGTVWTNLGRGLWHKASGTVPGVNALAVDAHGNVYVAGDFDTAGGITAYNIAKWNGTSWSALGNGLANWPLALAVDSNNNVYSVDLQYGVGRTISKWNGSQWTILGVVTATKYIHAMAFDEEDNLYVGGSFTNIGSVNVARVAKWDGSSWHALGSGIADGEVRALAADAGGVLYAAGTFTNAGDVQANRFAMWNGSVWTNLRNGADWDVNAVALSSLGHLVAGGQFMTVDGLTVRHVAAWNGATWTNLGSGMVGGFVYGLDVDEGNTVYVGGNFTQAGGKPATNVARYHGIPEPAGWGMLTLFTIYELRFTIWRRRSITN